MIVLRGIIATAIVGLLLIGAIPAGADHTSDNLYTPTGEDKDKVLTRNVALGDPITICSADFPLSTTAAIKWWEDKFGTDLFDAVSDDLSD